MNKYRNISCAVQFPDLPSAFNCIYVDSTTTVTRTNEQHGHHSYRHHCSMVQNVNHNRKKQIHR